LRQQYVPPSGLLVVVGGGLMLLLAVAFIYHKAVTTYFYNDDFQWLQQARQFELANVLRLDRYDHFYRPVIEVYFHVGSRLFGCSALPFHLASIEVHLVNTLLLFLFARDLSGRLSFASLTALFFCVQPGFVQAVVWVGAITDLLPALWYLLTLWMYLLFLQRRRPWFYGLALVAFALCHLTHESSATLLAMMVALEATVLLQAGSSLGEMLSPRRVARYVPFAAMLIGYLLIAYAVNSRSYLVQEGHYRFGWHVVPNMFRYIVALSVWTRALTSYVVIAAVMAALVVRAGPRLRFSVLWIFVTLAPASLFTWGIESRYLYLPAAGFALVLADLMLGLYTSSMGSFSPRVARIVTIFVVAGVSVRFAVFAEKSARDFRQQTRPYEELAVVVRETNPAPGPGGVVVVDRSTAETVPPMYLEPALQTIYCRSDVRAIVR
jgi:hypothetical protein